LASQFSSTFQVKQQNKPKKSKMEFLRFLILFVILAFAAAQLPDLSALPIPAGLPIPLPGATTGAPEAEGY
jgi:hypothetical protein